MTHDPPRFDTDDVAAGDRFEVWTAGIGGVFRAALPAGADRLAFRAAAQCRLFGRASIVSGELSAVRMWRTAGQAAGDGLDVYAVVLYESGDWEGEIPAQGRTRRVAARPRLPVLLDMSQPIDVDARTGRYMILNLARDLLDDCLPADTARHGLVLDGAAGALLREQMHAIDRHAAGLHGGAGDGAARSLAHGVAACLSGLPGAFGGGALEDGASGDGARNLRRLSLRYIDRELHRSDLSPDRICAALGVSRSSLYRAFAGGAGVAATIQRRRLDRIRRALADRRDTRSIGEIRELYGFGNASHFCVAFLRRFGCSPSQARDRLHRHDAGGDGFTVPDHHGWKMVR